MKYFIVLLAITFSVNSFAIETSKGSLAMLIQDAHEYQLNGGHASVYLAQQIRILKRSMKVSNDEAVEILISVAEEQMNLSY
jgi:glucan phosphorylase